MSELKTDPRHPAIAAYARHVNPAFVKLLGVFGYGRVFVRAQDVWVWDDQERRYLDFLAGFGSANLGHNHPRLIEKLRATLSESMLNLVHIGPSIHTAELAERLAKVLKPPLEVSLFANSGAEAVDAAMKTARAATGRKGFVHCQNGFHGTSLSTLSIMSESRLREPFEPLISPCQMIPFGDLTMLENALAMKQIAGFIVEPIQCEGGVILPPQGYLKDAQALCTQFGTLLILDEVQTGIARTGPLFSYESENFVPDILVLGKALGGGIAPVSVAVTSREIHGRAYGSMDRFDLHGSTFAGNAFACVAASETLKITADEKLSENSVQRGTQLLNALRAKLSGHPFIKDIRGSGLLVGIELGPNGRGISNTLMPGVVKLVSQKVFGQWAALKLLEAGVICQPASQQWNVLKLEPPLTIKSEEIERVVTAIVNVFEQYTSLPSLLSDVSMRLVTQQVSGGAFR